MLANFQSSLQEITIIAMECNSNPSDAASEFGGTAVEFQSYVDPTKENDSLLHTQLWIDPVEEFVQYAHNGNPVDVTFAFKELKAFLAFCEGCEVDIHLYFEKAGDYTLDLRQMECQTGLILGKLLENSQRGIEQVLLRFHQIIPEYGLTLTFGQEVLQAVAVVLMEGKFQKNGF